MTANGPANVQQKSLAGQIDRVCDEFESNWQSHRQPDLVTFVARLTATEDFKEESIRRRLLYELVRIDLDHRWRQFASAEARDPRVPPNWAAANPQATIPPCPTLAHYVRVFPELDRAGALPVSLVAEEFRVRTRWGDRPSVEEFAARFPLLADDLATELRRIECELETDQRTAKLNATADSPGGDGAEDAEREAEANSYGRYKVLRPVNREFGRYEVRRLMERGELGSVYAGYDPQLHRGVVIKVPRAERFLTPQSKELFIREARKVARLDGPGILPVYDVGMQDGQCYIVYKFLEGQSLEDRLKHGTMSHESAAALVADIADALDLAHQSNLYHRDVRPAHILLDRNGNPYVSDFGLAVGEGELNKARGRLSGPLAYMAPELLRGDGHLIDGRADIYSVGVILYELLCNRQPFHGNLLEELSEKMLSCEPRPPREFDRSVPAELERICLKAMAKPIAARYATARNMAAELRSFVENLPAAEVTAAPQGILTKLQSGKSGCAVTALFVALLAFSVPRVGRRTMPPNMESPAANESDGTESRSSVASENKPESTRFPRSRFSCESGARCSQVGWLGVVKQ